MKPEKDVVVILESFGDNRQDIDRRLLKEGSRIAAQLGGRLHAMALGSAAEDRLLLQGHGVSALYLVEGSGLADYSSEAFAWAAQSALKDIPFRLLLLAHTDRGSELAPRIACYLDTAAVTDCVDIRIKNRTLVYVRLLYGARLEQEVSFAEPGLEVATIKHEALDAGKAVPGKPLEVIRISAEPCPSPVSPRALQLVPPDYKTVDVLYAKRIIGVGSGCDGPVLLKLVEELCALLEGSVGTTRPMVDDGYLPRERLIGQTGKTVVPELYIALGISGSPHHVAGIQGSKEILSLNRDPRAPIFGVSDAGYVCDIKTLLPKLIDRIKRYRDEGHI
jgi:electron transfer flavoprotein alpha subunit